MDSQLSIQIVLDFTCFFENIAVADPRGLTVTRFPFQSNFFHFDAVFGKKVCKIIGFSTPLGLVPPLGNLGSATELEKHRCWRIRHWNSSYYQTRRKYYAKMLFNRIGNSENIANLSWRLWFFLLTHCCIKEKYKTYEFVVSNVFSVLRQSNEATD